MPLLRVFRVCGQLFRQHCRVVRQSDSRFAKFSWRAGALCGGSVLASLWGLQHTEINVLPTVHASTRDSPRLRFNFIADVVEKARPAVVSISTR